MASIAEMITALTNKVDALSTSWQSKLDTLNDARVAATTATAAVLNALAGIFDTGARVSLFIDPINGDDANNGVSVANAVRTWSALVPLFQANRYIYVAIVGSDLIVDKRFALNTTPSKIYFVGFNQAGTAVERRKMVFTDSPTQANTPGGLVTVGALNLNVLDVDIELAYDAARPAINPVSNSVWIGLRNCIITRTGIGDPFFDGVFSGHFSVSNTVIDASASGHIISGVPAGSDPASLPGVTANFTQA